MYGEGTTFGTREYSIYYQDMYTEKPSWNRNNWEKIFDGCIICLGIILFIVAIPIIFIWALIGGE